MHVRSLQCAGSVNALPTSFPGGDEGAPLLLRRSRCLCRISHGYFLPKYTVFSAKNSEGTNMRSVVCCVAMALRSAAQSTALANNQRSFARTVINDIHDIPNIAQ